MNVAKKILKNYTIFFILILKYNKSQHKNKIEYKYNYFIYRKK